MATKDDLRRYANVLARELRRPGHLARSIVRAPLEGSAGDRISALPRRELTDFVPGGDKAVTIADASSRHSWSLGCVEQIVLQLLVADRAAASAFEIGTFNGGTTKLIAEALPADGRVVTLDLPPEQFNATQSPEDFVGRHVGQAFVGTPAESKIVQELGDSLTFDFDPYRRSADLVLVDGAHDYEHGFSDTRNALRLVRPGGIIIWDDFEPYWHGLVHGILDATAGLPIAKLAGTSFAVLEA